MIILYAYHKDGTQGFVVDSSKLVNDVKLQHKYKNIESKQLQKDSINLKNNGFEVTILPNPEEENIKKLVERNKKVYNAIENIAKRMKYHIIPCIQDIDFPTSLCIAVINTKSGNVNCLDIVENELYIGRTNLSMFDSGMLTVFNADGKINKDIITVMQNI